MELARIAVALLLLPLVACDTPRYPYHHAHACVNVSLPFCDTTLAIADRVADLISRLTLEQKVSVRRGCVRVARWRCLSAPPSTRLRVTRRRQRRAHACDECLSSARRWRRALGMAASRAQDPPLAQMTYDRGAEIDSIGLPDINWNQEGAYAHGCWATC